MTPKRRETLAQCYVAESAKPVTLEDARAIVEQLVFDVEVSRRSGALAEINRQYRARRLAGLVKLSYAAFLEDAIAELVIAAARSV